MPTRTCVVCRKTAEKNNLLRFVLVDGRATIACDVFGQMPGRGAYCHVDVGCLSAKKSGAMIRSALHGRRGCRSSGCRQKHRLEGYESFDYFVDVLRQALKRLECEFDDGAANMKRRPRAEFVVNVLREVANRSYTSGAVVKILL